MAYGNYKELIVWQKSMDLAKQVYIITELLPTKEIYALSSQMRRAAVSIPSNIAEGHSRSSRAEYVHFLSISRGSLSELETQIYLCESIGFLDKKQIEPVLDICEEIQKMLSKLIVTLQ